MKKMRHEGKFIKFAMEFRTQNLEVIGNLTQGKFGALKFILGKQI